MPSDLMDRYSLFASLTYVAHPCPAKIRPMARSSLSQASLNPRVRAWHADALFERARIASFRHEDDRRRFVTSHALVRLVLSQATGLPATKLRFAAGALGVGGRTANRASRPHHSCTSAFRMLPTPSAWTWNRPGRAISTAWPTSR